MNDLLTCRLKAPVRLAVILMLAATLALLASCGGGSAADSMLTGMDAEDSVGAAAPEVQAPSTGETAGGSVLAGGAAGFAGAFPAPSNLPRTVSGPPGQKDRLRDGYSWAYELPNHNVTNAVFEPLSSQSGPAKLADCAYACFVMDNMGGYSGSKRLVLDWVTGAKPDSTAVGLANFNADRWDWYSPDTEFKINLPDLERYVSPADQMYICLVVWDTFYANLAWVLVGDGAYSGLALSLDLDEDPLLNTGPRIVQCDASYTEPVGGKTHHWDWDWDSDGTWDVTGDADGKEANVYEPGNWTLTVRATSEEGEEISAMRKFLIINPENHPPNAVIDASETSGNAPLTVNFNAQATYDSDGLIIKYEWDCDNDGVYEFDTGTDFQQVYTFARKGLNLVHLRVTDNDLATDTAAVGIFLNNGWRTTVIDPDVKVNENLSMAAIGSGTKVPCVVYQRFNGLEDVKLRFARAQVADGSEWNEPVQPVTSATLRTGYAPSVVALVGDGSPLIAYGTRNLVTAQPALYVVGAADGNASSWNLPQLVSGAELAGTVNSLAIINTIPAIASLVGGDLGTYQLKYFMAQNAQGTSWNPGQAVTDPGTGNYYSVSLGASGSGPFKHPTLAYANYDYSGPAHAAVAIAGDFDGNSWDLAYQSGEFYATEVSLALVAGNPALAFGTDSQQGEGYYVRAADPAGDGWGNPVHAFGGSGGSLALLNDKPAYCFRDFETPGLSFATAKDAEGTSWNQPYLIDTSTSCAFRNFLLVNDNLPVICYDDIEYGYLKAAYWEN